jgi:hypothetical protein
MMKAREGYVYFDERSKNWVARFSPFVNAKSRKNFTRSRTTRKEALQALREMIQQYETKGATAFENENLSFEQLADRYREAKMMQAEFVGERKVAGMRAQSSSQSYWRALRDYFGSKRIRTIKYDDLEALKLHLVRKPTRHGKQRSITDTNRHLQFPRAMLNYAVANRLL